MGIVEVAHDVLDTGGQAQFAALTARMRSPRSSRACSTALPMLPVAAVTSRHPVSRGSGYGPLKISRAAKAVPGKSENTPSTPSRKKLRYSSTGPPG